MNCQAMFRLPRTSSATRITQTAGQPEVIDSYTALNGKRGFVFAPFVPSAKCPILLIKPDSTETINIPSGDACADSARYATHHLSDSRESYAADFSRFHSNLQAGKFDKLVLSRHSTETTSRNRTPEQLFTRACQLYPRMFVALVSTPQSGTWLMATPEILAEGDGHEFATIALAGSMRLRDDQLDFDTPHHEPSQDNILWNDKNTQEQAYVASYINERLRRFTDDVRQSGPYTARAGRMVHLRSDFRFRLDDTMRMGDLIDSLHPTPAVCGIPKEEARRFILENESGERKYYSGFCGPLCPDGETHLYVSLRCMEITSEGYILHAGGGLLKESVEKDEWQESEDKMDTMRSVLLGE